MNLLKILIPAVVIKKLYGNKHSKHPKSRPLTDDEKDLAQDYKDDNS